MKRVYESKEGWLDCCPVVGGNGGYDRWCRKSLEVADTVCLSIADVRPVVGFSHFGDMGAVWNALHVH